MLSSLKNMFKVPDLRNKILFTLLIIALYRLGAHIPVPGIDVDVAADARSSQAETRRRARLPAPVLGRRAHPVRRVRARDHAVHHRSIIMQVLGVVIPKLEEWQKQGAVGQRKITQWTRYLTIGHRHSCRPPALTFVFHNGGGRLLRRQQRARTSTCSPATSPCRASC